MTTLTRIAALSSALLLLAGCKQTPVATVSIANVGVSTVTDEAAVLVFRLDAGAMGDEPLSLKEVKYTLSIDGHVVFSGTRYAEATTTAELSQTIDLPAPIPASEVQWPLHGVRRYRIHGSVAFLRPGPIGEMLYDLGVKRRRVRFSESGGLDFGAGGAEVEVQTQATDSAAASEQSSDSPR